jgi:hypothetical protein
MEENDFDEFRRRLYKRALEEQNSNLWNFKRYYTASAVWSWFDVGTSVVMAFMGAVLTYGLAWRQVPLTLMVFFSLFTGTVSLFKANKQPGQRAERLHTIGERYHRLHDEIQDFIELDLKDTSRKEKWLRERFEELSERRHSLKSEEQLSGVWYRWLKWRRSDEIYNEAITTDDEMKKLDPDGFNIDREETERDVLQGDD